ncbi:MAG: gliding motility-associated C-terminal domain-containing protein [Chitinophagaceae bacterium]|nr:gliding motility-associated C-terminal domain-containing protein [Chitinophagaceae bacterium]
MRSKNILLLLMIMLCCIAGMAQPCTTLGQTPPTAFPVCGTSTFVQNNVPICGGTPIPTSCNGGQYADVNPFWYRFTCYTSGTLGFILDPVNNNDDYDWVLFDITNRNPNDIYTVASLNIAENWSATPGNTGASNNTNGLRHCAGGTPNFSSLISINAGREYLLMASNWSASQQGYSLTFTGGTAVITDPLLPTFQGASVNCSGTEVIIRFNKAIRCNSLAANGSDFSVAGATIASVTGFGCSSSFDMDSVRIVFSAPLAPGNYTVTMMNGSDGNTLLDNCGTGILSGSTIPFTVNAQSPLPMGAVTPPSCLPTSVTLTFPDPVLCNSIAANGSDFIVTGPATVTITSATAVNCNSIGETNTITLQLSAPILTGGNYQVQAAIGTDGNTIVGQCNRQVTAGNSSPFTLAVQPAIAMGTITPPPCTPQSVTLTFAEPVNCNSVAANGSDFIVTGPSAVAIASASAVNCTNGETNTITIQFATPVLVSGTYQVEITTGSDGNTLVGPCNRMVTAGSMTTFTLAAQPPYPIGTVSPVSCAPAFITLSYTNDPLDCTSISPDGSEFIITGPSAVVISSAGGQCNVNPNLQTISIQLAAPITVSGTYQLLIQNGSDGNTIRGNCNRYILVGDFTAFNVPDVPPVPMDSLVPVACSPSSLRLILDDPIRCASIASNGSDFIVSGPAPVTVVSASGVCDANGLTRQIDIILAAPVVTGGNYQLQLVSGSDGNTLLSECYRATPANTLAFTAGDTVSAVFQYQVIYDCETDEITFTHDGRNNVNQWAWTVNGSPAGTSPSFTQSFSASSQNQVQLNVSNGICTDSHTENIVLDNKVAADFTGPDMICPDDTASFTDMSTGQIDNWQWSFGNGNSSSLSSPPLQTYPSTGTETLYPVTLTVSNNLGCRTSITKNVKVFGGCTIAVPTAFTPDGDGLNDHLYPLNAFKADNLDFKVFNRWGQLVFHSRDWTRKWDGRVNGIMQATTVYVWTLNYTHRDTKVKYSLKGTTTLIRK